MNSHAMILQSNNKDQSKQVDVIMHKAEN